MSRGLYKWLWWFLVVLVVLGGFVFSDFVKRISFASLVARFAGRSLRCVLESLLSLLSPLSFSIPSDILLESIYF